MSERQRRLCDEAEESHERTMVTEQPADIFTAQENQTNRKRNRATNRKPGSKKHTIHMERAEAHLATHVDDVLDLGQAVDAIEDEEMEEVQAAQPSTSTEPFQQNPNSKQQPVAQEPEASQPGLTLDDDEPSDSERLELIMHEHLKTIAKLDANMAQKVTETFEALTEARNSDLWQTYKNFTHQEGKVSRRDKTITVQKDKITNLREVVVNQKEIIIGLRQEITKLESDIADVEEEKLLQIALSTFARERFKNEMAIANAKPEAFRARS